MRRTAGPWAGRAVVRSGRRLAPRCARWRGGGRMCAAGGPAPRAQGTNVIGLITKRHTGAQRPELSRSRVLERSGFEHSAESGESTSVRERALACLRPAVARRGPFRLSRRPSTSFCVVLWAVRVFKYRGSWFK
eukprot:6867910-Prymnesium_polylepis.1